MLAWVEESSKYVTDHSSYQTSVFLASLSIVCKSSSLPRNPALKVYNFENVYVPTKVFCNGLTIIVKLTENICKIKISVNVNVCMKYRHYRH